MELEQQLCLLHEQYAVIVVPLYDTQEESWVGNVIVNTEMFPVTFQLCSVGYARKFTVYDVSRIETNMKITLSGTTNQTVIYLKGRI